MHHLLVVKGNQWPIVQIMHMMQQTGAKPLLSESDGLQSNPFLSSENIDWQQINFYATSPYESVESYDSVHNWVRHETGSSCVTWFWKTISLVLPRPFEWAQPRVKTPVTFILSWLRKSDLYFDSPDSFFSFIYPALTYFAKLGFTFSVRQDETIDCSS